MNAAALIAQIALFALFVPACASSNPPAPAPAPAPATAVAPEAPETPRDSATQKPLVRVEIPRVYLAGDPYRVQIELEASEDCRVDANLIGAASFELDGRPLTHGEACTLELKAGDRLSRSIDLSEWLPASGGFTLAHTAGDAEPVAVLALEPADPRTEYDRLLPAELDKYWVVLDTNRGQIVVEFWPKIAPGHVKNFLDLSATGFYDGVTFHRVMKGFMLQGGDPTGTGAGNGPRMLQAEFSKEVKHVRGVLSMARTPDPNSASCQFFIMHGAAPHLDGDYSAFGAVVTGLAVVDAIAATQVGAGDRPVQPQVIRRALVVRAPEHPESYRDRR